MRRPLLPSWKIMLFLCFTGLLFPSLLFAGAYYFPQHGARAATMGNAFVAIADDATAVFHNPAGMTQIEEGEGSYNLNLFFPDFTYTREANGQTYPKETQELKVMSPFYLGYVQPFKKYDDFYSGFALYDSWGGLPKWDKTASSRYILKHMYLIILHGTYAVGYKAADWFSVGGGLSLIYCWMEQHKSLDFQDLAGKEAEEDYWNEMDILLSGDTWDFGWNVGFLLHPGDDFSIGLTYTSEVALDADVTLKSTTPFLLSALMEEMVLDADLTLMLPQNVRLGCAYQITDDLKAAIDVTWVNWDVAKDTDVIFPEGEFFIQGRDSIPIPRNWQDSFTYSIGFEYKTDWWEGASFRCGYTFDEWAIPEETMMTDNPDADKHMIGFGSSYQYNDKTIIDFGYEIRLYEDRHVTNSIYASDDPEIVGGVANGYYEETIHAVYIGARMYL